MLLAERQEGHLAGKKCYCNSEKFTCWPDLE